MAFDFTYNSPISPLMLADRLLTLAQDADRAGYPDAASQLVSLLYSVLDEPAPSPSALPSWARPVSEPSGQTRQFRRPAGRASRASHSHI